eukprot:m.151424 g.151424  ORF g.151424 m.151424 type:complete len:484 (+) comp14249_c0_seq5:4014-5465(+)
MAQPTASVSDDATSSAAQHAEPELQQPCRQIADHAEASDLGKLFLNSDQGPTARLELAVRDHDLNVMLGLINSEHFRADLSKHIVSVARICVTHGNITFQTLFLMKCDKVTVERDLLELIAAMQPEPIFLTILRYLGFKLPNGCLKAALKVDDAAVPDSHGDVQRLLQDGDLIGLRILILQTPASEVYDFVQSALDSGNLGCIALVMSALLEPRPKLLAQTLNAALEQKSEQVCMVVIQHTERLLGREAIKLLFNGRPVLGSGSTVVIPGVPENQSPLYKACHRRLHVVACVMFMLGANPSQYLLSSLHGSSDKYILHALFSKTLGQEDPRSFSTMKNLSTSVIGTVKKHLQIIRDLVIPRPRGHAAASSGQPPAKRAFTQATHESSFSSGSTSTPSATSGSFATRPHPTAAPPTTQPSFNAFSSQQQSQLQPQPSPPQAQQAQPLLHQLLLASEQQMPSARGDVGSGDDQDTEDDQDMSVPM